MNNGKPTHIDLCAGFGGFSIAAEWAGFRTIGFSEIADYPSRILARHWPDVPNWGDIRNTPVIRCVLLTCGDPCPPFSVAGRKLGEGDHRYIWPSVLDAIGRHNPDWCVLENVVGVKGMVLSQRFDDLAARGYQCQAFDIPSCSVGLPSVERHVWTIAARDGERLERNLQAGIPGKQDLEQEISFGGAVDDGSPIKRIRPDLPLPGFCRSSKGSSFRIQRITGIGNAVPPQVPFQIFKVIRQIIENERRNE